MSIELDEFGMAAEAEPGLTRPGGALPYATSPSYLGSTGTQYIDTGITPGADFTAEIVLSGTVSAGGRQGWQNNEFRITSHPDKIDIVYANGGETVAGDFSDLRTVKFGTDGKFYVDGVQIAERSGTISNFFSFYLFQFNNGGSAAAGGGTGRIARAILKAGGKTVRDFVPAVSFAGLPGLFDRVTQKFFYNNGTGSFVRP